MTGTAAARRDRRRRCFRDQAGAGPGDDRPGHRGGGAARWAAGDEVYGQNTPLRDWLEEHRVSYVLAVPKSFTAATAAGPKRADDLAALVPAAGWQQISWLATGPRDPVPTTWALIGTASPARQSRYQRRLTNQPLPMRC